MPNWQPCSQGLFTLFFEQQPLEMHHSFHTGPVPRVRCLPLASLTQLSGLNARLREREEFKLTQLSGLGARLPEQEVLQTGIYFQQVISKQETRIIQVLLKRRFQ